VCHACCPCSKQQRPAYISIRQLTPACGASVPTQAADVSALDAVHLPKSLALKGFEAFSNRSVVARDLEELRHVVSVTSEESAVSVQLVREYCVNHERYHAHAKQRHKRHETQRHTRPRHQQHSHTSTAIPPPPTSPASKTSQRD
jgi:hypothetical protein